MEGAPLRLPDWRQRLIDHIVATAGEPFKPGTHDCALAAANAVKAMTGKDYARGFRGYRTIAEGLRKLKAKGYEDHVALVAEHFEEIPPSMAQVGDIAVVQGDDGLALAIVQGELLYVTAPQGRALVPLTSAKRAFRVPC